MPEVATIRSQIQQNNTRARQILAEVAKLQALKRTAKDEISRGEICSGCNQTRSEIEAKGEHFPHPGQHILVQSAAEIAAKQAEKDREFSEKIAALYKELRELEGGMRELYFRADRLIYEARMAEMKAQQAAQKERLREQQEKQAAQLKQSGKELSDVLKKSFQDAADKLEQQRTTQQAELSAQRGQFFIPSTEDKQLTTDLRQLTSQIQDSRTLSPQVKTEQDRLQELANAGLASGPTARDLNGVLVVADNVASVWNRLMEVKESAEKVGKAFDRLVTDDRPSAIEGTKLVLENASDTTKLGNQVLGQLSPAADALLAGNYEQARKVQTSLDAATGKFEAGVDSRTRRASPEYDIVRSAQDFGTSVEQARQPLTPPASSAERVENYTKAAGSAWDVLMAEPAKADEKKQTESPPANAVRWGSATGAGPLGEKAAKTFRNASYTEYVTPQTVILYSISGGEAGKPDSYWTRTPPSANTASKTVKIRVPPGTKLFEGIAATEDNLVGGEKQIFIQQIDSAWEIKQ